MFLADVASAVDPFSGLAALVTQSGVAGIVVILSMWLVRSQNAEIQRLIASTAAEIQRLQESRLAEIKASYESQKDLLLRVLSLAGDKKE